MTLAVLLPRCACPSKRLTMCLIPEKWEHSPKLPTGGASTSSTAVNPQGEIPNAGRSKSNRSWKWEAGLALGQEGKRSLLGRYYSATGNWENVTGTPRTQEEVPTYAVCPPAPPRTSAKKELC